MFNPENSKETPESQEDPAIQLNYEFAKDSLEEFMGTALSTIELVALKKIIKDTLQSSKANNGQVRTHMNRILPFIEAQATFLRNYYGVTPETQSFLSSLTEDQRKQYFEKAQREAHFP